MPVTFGHCLNQVHGGGQTQSQTHEPPKVAERLPPSIVSTKPNSICVRYRRHKRDPRFFFGGGGGGGLGFRV